MLQLSQEEQKPVADWYQFQDQEVPWFDQFSTVMPSARAGSLILWDSRTAHAVRPCLAIPNFTADPCFAMLDPPLQ